ncbi:hypothetical protein ACMFMG_002212 [Clarireedia jacksonii]
MNTASKLPVFEYQSLDFSTDSIRLLEIVPGPEEAIIQCNIRNANMTEAYICLSYTWEPRNPSHDIEINGMSTAVGENLWQFLHAARSVGITRSVWIDTLCINQSYHQEKNHQVALMREIYEKAEHVIIWFGPSHMDDISKDFLDELKRCALFVSIDPRGIHTTFEFKAFYNTATAQRAFVKANIARFLSLSYWTRIWIIQEVMLPKVAVVLLGLQEVALAPLALVLVDLVDDEKLDLEENERTELRSLPGYKFAWSQYLFEYSMLSYSQCPLPSLIHAFSRSGCCNKLDRIYALLSLAENGNKFTVDYDISIEMMFQRAMSFCMDGRPLDDLLLVGASLIEALDLQGNRIDDAISTIGKPSLSELGLPSYLTVKCNPSLSVASPVRGQAALKTDESSSHSPYWESTNCLYVVVSDADNLHIFEYAVEENESGIRVNYARAHEYIRGRPQIYKEPTDHSDSTFYLWFDAPSEEVHYLDYSLFKDRGSPSLSTLSRLVEWESPWFILFEDTSIIPTDDHPGNLNPTSYRLKPAKRCFEEHVPWGRLTTFTPPILFTSPSLELNINRDVVPQLMLLPREKETLLSDDNETLVLDLYKQFRLRCKGQALGDATTLKMFPHTPRSTTLRFEIKESKNDDDSSEVGGSTDGDDIDSSAHLSLSP